MQEEFSQHFLAKRYTTEMLPACTPSTEIFWTGSTKHSQFRNAESPIVKLGKMCIHLISALKYETTFESAKHPQTMAAAIAALRTSRESLFTQELKRITDPTPAATEHTLLKIACRSNEPLETANRLHSGRAYHESKKSGNLYSKL